MTETLSPRRVQRVRYELRRRQLAVARTERIGANFIALTFSGAELEGFQSGSFDDHVKVLLPSPGGELVGRDYTPRTFDAGKGELTIEFLVHGGGLACQWANAAEPGTPVTIGGPRGSMIIPADYPHHLLAGDATALPAISRRLEELPAGVKADVIVQVGTAADEREFRTLAGATVRWVRTADELVRAVGDTPLSLDGFAWCAGEASAMARLRDNVLRERGHPKEAARISAYWKRGASGHHEDLS